MRPTFRSLVSPAASVLFLALGSFSQAQAGDSLHEPVPYELGTSLDFRYSPAVAREVCVDGTAQVNPASQVSLQIQEVKGRAELRAALAQSANIELADILTTEGQVEYQLDIELLAGVTVFTLNIETVERHFALADDDDANGPCDSDIPTDTEGFLDTCGTGYLEKEVLGGTVVVVASTAQLDLETSIDGSIEAQVSLGDVSAGGNAVAELLAKLSAGVIDASVFIDGLPPLSYGSSDLGLFQVESQQLESYLQALHLEVEQGLDPGNPHRTERLAAYGKPLRQAFQASHALMGACGVELPQHAAQGLNCAAQLHAEVLEATRPEVAKDAPSLLDIDQIETMIEEASIWEWGEDAESNQAAHLAVAAHLAFCKENVLPDALATCQEATLYGLFEEGGESGSLVCDACTIPDDVYELDNGTYATCSPDDLRRLVDDLDTVFAYNPAAPEVKHTRVIQDAPAVDIASRTDNLCALSGISGRFAGAGESVKISPTSSTWRLEVDSQRTESSERVWGSTVCVQRDAFVDTTASPDWLDEGSYEATSAKGALPDSTYVSVLAGLRGKLDGVGDGAQVLQDDPSEVLAHGVTHRAFAYGLGVLAPNAAGPAYTTHKVSSNDLPEAMGSADLARTDEAFCMLTGVFGNFDGGGESVRLVEGTSTWKLEVRAACTDTDSFFGGGTCIERKPVTATALCYAYAQD